MSDVSHLIQQIRNIASAYPEGLGTDAQAALNHSANEVELHIAELEAAQQWTRVEDGLPTKHNNYRVCVRGYVRGIDQFYQRDMIYSAAHGGWVNDIGEPFDGPSKKVSHWMPLPPAPQEQTK